MGWQGESVAYPTHRPGVTLLWGVVGGLLRAGTPPVSPRRGSLAPAAVLPASILGARPPPGASGSPASPLGGSAGWDEPRTKPVS